MGFQGQTDAPEMPRFVQRSTPVQAVRLAFAGTFTVTEGCREGDAGDWLVWGPRGGLYILTDERFRSVFEPANEAGLRELARPSM